MAGERPRHRLFAALYDPVTAGAERRVFPRHREYLATDLPGRVLDLGTGTGAMLPHYADGRPSPSVTAVEPDPHMRRRARERAAGCSLDVSFVDATAGALPFREDAFDAVVSAMVLCTVPDVDAALGEVARVLAADGEFRMLEHVHAGGWLGRVQSLVAPAWRAVAGGCTLDRETGRRLRDHAAFEVVDLERFALPTHPATPFVRGTLVPAAD